MTTVLLLLFSLLAQGWAAPEPLAIAETLFLTNGVNIGAWGPIAMCPANSYANGFEMKYETVDYHGDDTAMNALKLYCMDNTSGMFTNSITSLEGLYGTWRGYKPCPQTTPGFYNYLSAVNAYVFADQGLAYQDWGMEFVDFMCAHGDTLYGLNPHPYPLSTDKDPVVKRERMTVEGREVEAVHFNIKRAKEEAETRGTYSGWLFCNLAFPICGLQTRVDTTESGDDFGMTDLILFCCS